MFSTTSSIACVMLVVWAMRVESRGVRRNTRPWTTLPWTTLPPTTLPPTTIPAGCRTDTGEWLYPGQQKQFVEEGSCRVCSCSYHGGGYANCYYTDCLVPMCVDAYRPQGGCCRRCPNGRNCRIPMTGEVISAQHPVERQGMICRCPDQKYMLPGVQSEADYTAICIPNTTIPPTTTPGGKVPVGRR